MPKLKRYQIDLQSEVYAAVHGQTARFIEWRYVGEIIARRCAKALRIAERQYPGRMIRARLIPASQWQGQGVAK